MADHRKQINAIRKKAGELSKEIDTIVEQLEVELDEMTDTAREGERGTVLDEKISMLTEWYDQIDQIAEDTI